MESVDVVVMPSKALDALHGLEIPAQQVVESAVAAQQDLLSVGGAQAVGGVSSIAVWGQRCMQALQGVQVPDLEDAIRTAAHDKTSPLHHLESLHPAIVPAQRGLAALIGQGPDLHSCVISAAKQSV